MLSDQLEPGDELLSLKRPPTFVFRPEDKVMKKLIVKASSIVNID